MVTATTTRPVGDMLRDWRRRRRLSQLELSNFPADEETGEFLRERAASAGNG